MVRLSSARHVQLVLQSAYLLPVQRKHTPIPVDMRTIPILCPFNTGAVQQRAEAALWLRVLRHVLPAPRRARRGRLHAYATRH